MNSLKDSKSRLELRNYMRRYIADRSKKNDLISYSLVSDFYNHFIEAEKNSNNLILQLQRNSV